MNVSPIHKHEYIELSLVAGQQYTRLYLPDLANLRNTHIVNITIYNSQDYPRGITGTNVITLATLQQIWVTLQMYNGKQFVNNRPAVAFLLDTTLTTVSQRNIRDFSGQKVNYPKSYLDFQPGFTPAGNLVIPISIYYADPKAVQAKDKKASFSKRT